MSEQRHLGRRAALELLLYLGVVLPVVAIREPSTPTRSAFSWAVPLLLIGGMLEVSRIFRSYGRLTRQLVVEPAISSMNTRPATNIANTATPKANNSIRKRLARRIAPTRNVTQAARRSAIALLTGLTGPFFTTSGQA